MFWSIPRGQGGALQGEGWEKGEKVKVPAQIRALLKLSGNWSGLNNMAASFSESDLPKGFLHPTGPDSD